MQTIIVIVIVAAAAAYLVWRFIRRGPGGGCGCGCSCPGPDKSRCPEAGRPPGELPDGK